MGPGSGSADPAGHDPGDWDYLDAEDSDDESVGIDPVTGEVADGPYDSEKAVRR